MKKIYVLLIILGSTLIFSSATKKLNQSAIDDTMSIAKLLLKNGDPVIKSKFPNKNIKGISVQKGKDIVEKGFSEKPDGGNSSSQSSHFVCTSCHNTQREDPDLSVNDPMARLKYTSENGLPFLQATTLYGAINRETYYNGDYEKKYGELVEPARNDIRGAIQLCATECAQGRSLKDWEIESILEYLWEIDLKIGDLNLDEAQKEVLGSMEGEKVVSLLKSKYLLKSEATFILPPEDRKEGYPYQGKPENGKLIYENSCLHCHFQQKYSFFHLDNGKLSFKHLKKKIGSYSRHSIYQVIRWGVPTKSGKHSYMPQFTKEKMSDEMVEDLRAYIEEQA